MFAEQVRTVEAESSSTLYITTTDAISIIFGAIVKAIFGCGFSAKEIYSAEISDVFQMQSKTMFTNSFPPFCPNNAPQRSNYYYHYSNFG
jgi:hypothetical protein